jgi:hypothetical protein
MPLRRLKAAAHADGGVGSEPRESAPHWARMCSWLLWSGVDRRRGLNKTVTLYKIDHDELTERSRHVAYINLDQITLICDVGATGTVEILMSDRSYVSLNERGSRRFLQTSALPKK